MNARHELDANSAPQPTDSLGRDLLTGLLRRATVEAGQVRSAFKRPLAQIVQGARDLLEQTPAELTSDIAQAI